MQKTKIHRSLTWRTVLLITALLRIVTMPISAAEVNLLNVSYDVSREFYQDINEKFVAQAKGQNLEVKITQSHGGSSAQARAVADGLPADVVTMNTSTDIEFLSDKGLVSKNWAKAFPNNASPTTSTMLFLVRNGNPRGIKDWEDLVKPGTQVIVVNPKTGGNGRMAYLAAWGAVRAKGGSDIEAKEFVRKLYKNVPVLARGGRDATGVFLQRSIGDVLITFESEVISVDREFGAGKVDVVHPSVSLRTENPVAIINRTVDKNGNRQLAQNYLQFLFSDIAQEIAVKHALRPSNDVLLQKNTSVLKPIKLFKVEEYFGSLAQAQKIHFADGGVFDQIYENK